MQASVTLLILAGFGPFGPGLTDGAVDATEAGLRSAVAMNPFGVAFVALTWAVLVGLNFWCLRKLLKHKNRA